MLTYPDRLPLAITPTPLAPLARLGARLGVELLVKRDDLTGAALTGNKIRKLEFLLAEARELGADTVITCGGVQSNHCRATAIAARTVGLDTVLLLRVPDPTKPPAVGAEGGNLLLDRMVGAEVRFVSHAQYAERKRLFVEVAEELRARGKRPYVIPEGGSNALGSWGYVRCVEELARELPPGPATIVYAAGSGGTGAGLVLGVQLLGLPWRVVGINVCDDRAYFVREIGQIVEEAARRWSLSLAFARDQIEIIDGYVGEGYAKSRPAELRLIGEVAATEGLLLDPVYTGKAVFGMSSELGRDRHSLGARVVFVHTGGIFGLVPKAAEIVAALVGGGGGG